jgi:hypothetical protein
VILPLVVFPGERIPCPQSPVLCHGVNVSIGIGGWHDVEVELVGHAGPGRVDLVAML